MKLHQVESYLEVRDPMLTIRVKLCKLFHQLGLLLCITVMLEVCLERCHDLACIWLGLCGREISKLIPPNHIMLHTVFVHDLEDVGKSPCANGATNLVILIERGTRRRVIKVQFRRRLQVTVARALSFAALSFSAAKTATTLPAGTSLDNPIFVKTESKE